MIPYRGQVPPPKGFWENFRWFFAGVGWPLLLLATVISPAISETLFLVILITDGILIFAICFILGAAILRKR